MLFVFKRVTDIMKHLVIQYFMIDSVFDADLRNRVSHTLCLVFGGVVIVKLLGY